MSNILSWCFKVLLTVVLRSALCQCHFFTVITWSPSTFCNSVFRIHSYYFSVLTWRQRETLNHQRACVIFLRQPRIFIAYAVDLQKSTGTRFKWPFLRCTEPDGFPCWAGCSPPQAPLITLGPRNVLAKH